MYDITEENTIYPRFTIYPRKDFRKGPSLVFLLHYYGLPLGEARYKVERLLSGQDIDVVLPDLTVIRDFYRGMKKINLSAKHTNEDTFFISK